VPVILNEVKDLAAIGGLRRRPSNFRLNVEHGSGCLCRGSGCLRHKPLRGKVLSLTLRMT
jgi:hypothetical protein